VAATDLITLAAARKAIRTPESDTSRDGDLAIYISAVTPVVEDITGPIIARAGTLTFDGGQPAILLPFPVTGVTSVVELGVVLTAGSDYVADLARGIVYRGAPFRPYVFMPGIQNVVIGYTAGTVPDTGSVPENIQVAARIILAQAWQSDQQGYRPAFGSPETGMSTTPTGFLIPNRAAAFLAASQADNVPGFA
jgi:hypothetical protein